VRASSDAVPHDVRQDEGALSAQLDVVEDVEDDTDDDGEDAA
jgi:hypothetical protein